MKILLVDHTPIYRDILRQTLAVYREFSLEFASTAAEARELANRHEFHFVAISRHLPDADGLEFVRELRRSGQFLFEPVVLLTSSVKAAIEGYTRRQPYSPKAHWISYPSECCSAQTVQTKIGAARINRGRSA